MPTIQIIKTEEGETLLAIVTGNPRLPRKDRLYRWNPNEGEYDQIPSAIINGDFTMEEYEL